MMPDDLELFMESNRRLQLVDGLRGIAASMVVLFHFWGNLPDASRDIVPGFLHWPFEHGNLGVDVFFVLSGFVIAHSIRNAVPSASYVARFALRRLPFRRVRDRCHRGQQAEQTNNHSQFLIL